MTFSKESRQDEGKFALQLTEILQDLDRKKSVKAYTLSLLREEGNAGAMILENRLLKNEF